MSVIVGLFCLAMYPLAAVVGTDDPAKFTDRMIGATRETVIIWENNTTFEMGLLNVGEMKEYYLEFTEKQIHFINITLEWTDEPPINDRWINKEDSFKLELFDPDGNEINSIQNDVGIIKYDWPGEYGIEYSGEFLIRVTLAEANDQQREVGLGFITYDDNSNEYKIIISYESYIIKEGEGDSADVRWHS